MRAYRMMSGGMKGLFPFVLLCSLSLFTADPTGNLWDVVRHLYSVYYTRGHRNNSSGPMLSFPKISMPTGKTDKPGKQRKEASSYLHISWQNSKPRVSYDPCTCGDHSEEEAVLGQNQLLTQQQRLGFITSFKATLPLLSLFSPYLNVPLGARG